MKTYGGVSRGDTYIKEDEIMEMIRGGLDGGGRNSGGRDNDRDVLNEDEYNKGGRDDGGCDRNGLDMESHYKGDHDGTILVGSLEGSPKATAW